ncbi:disease resistance protein RGA2-like [Phragmites australis]|uniref:disease resistance protein RGA2-like n=1 Tax=Phragmites australis TaxID=29695 RepID=UPI002D769367|nr:disease resistance protein RGA2-like [Phragmites australis]XP_062192992.1 disease resistance protein RGA2-like [Phragmites australis]XP_062192993.1 disease resistance protein RGA2-like [Phragmites australis]XP_062192994.1 disease resistance protein RGA2-like [Phragmites australis]XP_062192995.1 disease resistance protein RGA2-like [Phragmites australis]XP_062192996.1 disease resistance protein RGA2-like [Phragmites australis]XP_062192997.1 disease resistance protein RGA2-like [Phragmites a
MAEGLLLPVVRGVADKAADVLVQSVTLMWGVDDDRHKLERQMVYVQSLLADAEVKGETNPAVRRWTKELKAAAYQADDVLDDFQYEALRREALSGRSMASKVLSNFTSKNKFVFSQKASTDLKNVLDKIDELVTEMNKFGLLERAEAPQALYRQTHSALDESVEIYGRDDDKEEVVKLLLDQQDQHNVQVLPIIGMGGLGKTTLAKMVYNDSRVQNHFELKMWHCVSENFEATAIVRSVIELATNGGRDQRSTIELLRGKLQEVIGRKRFLLVLDDVWNEEQRKWEDDLKPLLCTCIGASGSMIVVTSRSQKVASIMGTLPPHELACLSEHDSWDLFSKKAFSKGVQEQEEFVTIGKRIINKCKGLPLALKTMGGLMSSKQRVREWEAIAESNRGGKDEVLSILKLSYKHLSSEMKQCFAFCAVFPKDYEMEKDKLILLWKANGFIHEEGEMDSEQKGEFIFNELAWRSFLQDVKVKSFYVESSVSSFSFSRETIGCKMHDLMHDLAKDVTDECACAEELIHGKVSSKDVRHMQISSNDDLKQISGLLKGTSSVRTLLLTPLEYEYLKVLKLTSLRALCCDDPSIIPSQLINMAHLRYLDLSGSSVETLPNSVCMLYNLQSLWLNGCTRLQYLPEGLATSLRKLSHIYLLGCYHLKQTPPKLSLLHNLHTLTKFIVGTEDGCGIEELKDLRQLGNRLELHNLRKVKCGSKANLHEKHNLSELFLYWGSDRIYNLHEEEVLESLVPHGELKILEVYGYGGLAISQWMRDPKMFQCLRELDITMCPRCKDIPIVWLSSSLEKLVLRYMESLTTLCKSIDVAMAGYNTPLPIFPKLKRMELWHLPELERWAENSAGDPINSVMFPLLEELSVSSCYKLGNFPESPVLKYLNCRRGGGLVPVSMPLGSWPSLVCLDIGLLADVVPPLEDPHSQGRRPLDTLQSLEVEGDDGFLSIFDLSKLQLGLGDYLAFLERLDISSCCNIVHWPVEELRYLPRLRCLSIESCGNLEGKGSSSEEEEILPLPQLEKLMIGDCHRLLEIPKLSASLEEMVIRRCKKLVALPSNLGNLPKLRYLSVQDCGALKSLPDGVDGFTSLEGLDIKECPGIEKFPQGLLQRLPTLEHLRIFKCPDLERCCGEIQSTSNRT